MKATAVIALTGLDEAKSPTSPKREQENFAIPEDIRLALVQRIQKSVHKTLSKIKPLEEKLEKECPAHKKYVFEFKSAALDIQYDYLNQCLSPLVNTEPSMLMMEYKRYIKRIHDLTKQDAVTDPKSLVKTRSKDYIALNAIEKNQIKTKTNAEETKRLPIENDEMETVLEIQKKIEEAAKVFQEQPQPTRTNVAKLIKSCTNAKIKHAKSFGEYLVNQTNLAGQIANLMSYKGKLLNLQKVCETSPLMLDALSHAELDKHNADILVWFLEEDEPNVLDAGGLAAIHYACIFGDIDLARTLLAQNSAAKELKTQQGFLPVQLIALRHYAHTKDFLRLLLPSEFKDFFLKDPSGKDLFTSAACWGNLSMIEFLTASVHALRKVSPETQKQCITLIVQALQFAAARRQAAIVDYLLGLLSTLPSVSTDSIHLALENAYYNGCENVVRVFCQHGLTMNDRGESALFHRINELTGSDKLSRIAGAERCYAAVAEEQNKRRLALLSLKVVDVRTRVESKTAIEIKPALEVRSEFSSQSPKVSPQGLFSMLGRSDVSSQAAIDSNSIQSEASLIAGKAVVISPRVALSVVSLSSTIPLRATAVPSMASSVASSGSIPAVTGSEGITQSIHATSKVSAPLARTAPAKQPISSASTELSNVSP